MFSRGPVLSEAKRDLARHALRAERSGGLYRGVWGRGPQWGVQGRSPGGGVRGRSPPGKFCENIGVLKQFQQYRRTKNRKTVVPEIQ